MPRIVFTGGGTAGHVIPAIALFEDLKAIGWEIFYIGSYQGIERKLIAEQDIPYYPVSTGKLRRYFDLQNFTDPFRLIRGYVQARKILKRIKPKVVFSKGGFVPVPVVVAASRLGIPVILHESDLTPGLANKLTLRYADKIFTTFPETVNYLQSKKAQYMGTPIRKSILQGDASQARKMCGFDADKPVIMIMGGSSGARAINTCIRLVLPQLLNDFQVIHLCGKGNLDNDFSNILGYAQYEFIGEEIPDIFAMADLIVSRAGANTLFEVLQLRLPNLLIPLSRKASRGDQIENAISFSSQGFSKVLMEEDMTPDSLYEAINDVYSNREAYILRMSATPVSNSNGNIIREIDMYRD